MKYPLIVLAILSLQTVRARSPLPLIHATSKTVSIRDGDYFDKDTWNLSPKAKPDIYTADLSRKPKYVTFYTDIDSIRIKLQPGQKVDFIILFNNTDSCYTEIASFLPEKPKSKRPETHDTIPFTLTANSAIHVKSTINDTATLDLHFDASSFDLALLTANYKKFRPLSKLQIGALTWTHPRLYNASRTATDMDGRFGWNLFAGRYVELDYDHSLLIVHSKRPKDLKGYTRTKLDYFRSFPAIKATIVAKNKTYTGNFILDTGSDQGVFLDSAWRSQNDFPTDLTLLNTSVMHDGGGHKYETKIVESPSIDISGIDFAAVPTWLLNTRNPAGFEINLLGNDLLKRFNIVFDFQNDYLYLKPNQLFNSPFKKGNNS
jgi:hypothetical protein